VIICNGHNQLVIAHGKTGVFHTFFAAGHGMCSMDRLIVLRTLHHPLSIQLTMDRDCLTINGCNLRESETLQTAKMVLLNGK